MANHVQAAYPVFCVRGCRCYGAHRGRGRRQPRACQQVEATSRRVPPWRRKSARRGWDAGGKAERRWRAGRAEGNVHVERWRIVVRASVHINARIRERAPWHIRTTRMASTRTQRATTRQRLRIPVHAVANHPRLSRLPRCRTELQKQRGRQKRRTMANGCYL